MRKSLAVLALMLAAAAPAWAEMPTTLKFCTGAEGGFYEKLGNTIGRSIVRGSEIKLEVLNTGGSVESAELLKEGECDIALLQADAVATLPLPTDVKATDAHLEAIYWLFPKDGEVVDFGEMEQPANAKRYGVAVVRGGGAQVTMNNFAKVDTDYAKVRQIEFDDWMQVGEAVAQGYTMRNGERIEIAGALYTGRMNAISSDITEDFGSLIKVGEVNDGDFASVKDVNGNPLYTSCEISSKQSSGIAVDTVGAADTYCVRAQVVYNNDYHKTLAKEDARKVSRMVSKGINSEVKTVR